MVSFFRMRLMKQTLGYHFYVVHWSILIEQNVLDVTDEAIVVYQFSLLT